MTLVIRILVLTILVCFGSNKNIYAQSNIESTKSKLLKKTITNKDSAF